MVQNLRSVPDTSGPSLTLNWDRPNNTQTATDVGTYIIRFRPSGCMREDSYCNMTVKAPTTSILITTQDGLKPLTKYDFEVRAQNENHEGEWSSVSEYIGICALNVIISKSSWHATLMWFPLPSYTLRVQRSRMRCARDRQMAWERGYYLHTH